VAHAQLVEPVLVEHPEGRLDDRLLRQRVAPAADRTLRRTRPRGRGEPVAALRSPHGHLNSVRVLNGLHTTK